MIQLILKICGGIVTASAATVIIFKISKWTKNLIEGIRCQLRHNIVSTYYRHLDEKQLREYEFQEYTKSFAAYKALNGNSFIDKINDEVTKWKIVP